MFSQLNKYIKVTIFAIINFSIQIKVNILEHF